MACWTGDSVTFAWSFVESTGCRPTCSRRSTASRPRRARLAATSSTSVSATPILPSPDIAVAKLAEAAQNPKNHRYSASRGIPNLRLAMATRYKNLFDVDLDPETEVVTTIGAKEGLTHLMWVLLGPGDSAIVPSPSYPIHLAGPGIRRCERHHGADARSRRQHQ
jgi:aspartate/methionine/tyrosine aminotransferase